MIVCPNCYMEGRLRGSDWVCLDCDRILKPEEHARGAARSHEVAKAETPPPDDYMAWNDGLAAHFYNPDAAGKPVYLDVEETALEAVHAKIGVGEPDDPRESFLAAVRATWGTGPLFWTGTPTGWRLGTEKVLHRSWRSLHLHLWRPRRWAPTTTLRVTTTTRPSAV